MFFSKKSKRRPDREYIALENFQSMFLKKTDCRLSEQSNVMQAFCSAIASIVDNVGSWKKDDSPYFSHP